MTRHGLLADHELGGDRAVRLPGRDKTKDLYLAGSQSTQRRGSARGPGKLVDADDVCGGTELLECQARGIEFHLSTVLVLERATRETHQDSDACRVIRRF